MQTSKKILLTITGIMLALIVSSLMILRRDTLAVLKEKELANQLTSVPTEPFHTVAVNGKWDLQIRQGRAQKVEVSFDKEGSYLPEVKQAGDTLYLSIAGDSTTTVAARIILPYLRSVIAKGANVNLKKMKLDSIYIELEDSYLINEENQFVYVTYETAGDSRIEFIDDPFQ